MAEREASWPRDPEPGLARDWGWPKVVRVGGLPRLEWLGWASVFGESSAEASVDGWGPVVRLFSPAGMSMPEREGGFTCPSVESSGLVELQREGQ